MAPAALSKSPSIGCPNSPGIACPRSGIGCPSPSTVPPPMNRCCPSPTHVCPSPRLEDPSQRLRIPNDGCRSLTTVVRSEQPLSAPAMGSPRPRWLLRRMEHPPRETGLPNDDGSARDDCGPPVPATPTTIAGSTEQATSPEPEAGPPSLPEFLARYRNIRFRDGVRCAHCQQTKVHRHGSFAERQRYRCLSCRRTFSDFTKSPLSYSKKPTLWPVYARCAKGSLTVRRCAESVGLSVSTAFRWRHAILDEVVNRDDTMLSGWIELVDLWFAYSEKGSRQRKEEPRRRGGASPSRWDRARVHVIVACDRQDAVFSDVVLAGRVSAGDLARSLAGRIEGTPLILADQGRMGPYASFARKLAYEFRDCRSTRKSTDESWSVSTAIRYCARFSSWLTRFCGVATKYLTNYLGWHRLLERRNAIAPELVAFGWPDVQASAV
jgi:transposase-like protein